MCNRQYELIAPYAHPILPFTNLVCALWLPMSYSSQCNRTVGPRNAFFNMTFLIVRKLLSWMSEVLSVHLRWQSEWRTTKERVFGARELNADQVSSESKQLRHAKRPIRTEAWWES